jgi:outer membrane immunogenic protein
MKRAIFGGVAIATLLIAASLSKASAADMPLKAPPAPAAPVWVWTGFYGGVNAGGEWPENNSVNTLGSLPFLNPVIAAAAGPAAVAGATANIPGSRAAGFIGGVQVGYNYQVNNFVAGVETDIQWLSGRSSATVANVVPITGFAAADNTTLMATNSVDWLGTLRGRLGVTVTPSLLVYGAGGLAYGEVKSSTTINQAITGPAAGGANGPYASFSSISQIRTGWTAGAGAELMLSSNWSAKFEYLYYDLGSVSYNGAMTNLAVGVVPVGTPLYTVGVNSSTSYRGNIARFGLNYKFGS